MNGVIMQSFVKNVLKDIRKAEKELRRKAATHVRDKMREKVSVHGGVSLAGQPPRKHSGDLYKGIGFKDSGQYATLVGVGPPAQHAHLLEFGTAHRQNKKGKDAGQVLARPFVLPTFEEEADTVKKILSEQWV